MAAGAGDSPDLPPPNKLVMPEKTPLLCSLETGFAGALSPELAGAGASDDVFALAGVALVSDDAPGVAAASEAASGSSFFLPKPSQDQKPPPLFGGVASAAAPAAAPAAASPGFGSATSGGFRSLPQHDIEEPMFAE